jgi:hypothetical protein
MLGGDPPGSFQVHMGHELLDTWVTTNYMEPLDSLFQQEGWTSSVFPQGVLDIISYQGKPYSVPVNIHRANVLWYNKKVFQDNNLQPPATFDDFFAVADALKAKGITPLALGDKEIFASVQLLETVLLGTLGPDAYKGLWTGATDWNSAPVTTAINTAKRMLTYVNDDHSSLTWDQANDLVINGTAGMTIMGDWVDADNKAKNFADSGWVPSPGTSGMYDALSDTFGLPKNAAEQREEARRREERFRKGRPAGDFSGRIVIIVDDGLATGATMRAAVRSARSAHAARVVVAVPAGSQEACTALRSEADDVVCLFEPEPFWAVGFYCEQFGQTEDSEVQQILADAHARRPVRSRAGP